MLFSIIILFFGLYRRTVKLSIFTFLLENINGDFQISLYIFFPIISFLIPIIFLKNKKVKNEKCIYIDLVLSLFISLIFVFSVPKIEAVVSNTDIYASNFVVKPKDIDRKSNFFWLRVSICSMTFGQIISDLMKEQ